VPVDCIAGTSMGALVGGGYASGIPASHACPAVKYQSWTRPPDPRAGVVIGLKSNNRGVRG
jgi:hypothetical protein